MAAVCSRERRKFNLLDCHPANRANENAVPGQLFTRLTKEAFGGRGPFSSVGVWQHRWVHPECLISIFWRKYYFELQKVAYLKL